MLGGGGRNSVGCVSYFGEKEDRGTVAVFQRGDFLVKTQTADI